MAFVGPSGGGKTTLASLAARFFDTTEGTVRIGGVDVRDIPSEKLMEKVSFVFQDSKLLKMSIYDNVRMGKKDATREEVLQALKDAQCEDIIAKMPNGIDTVIGSKGTYVSGGEAQRLSIARAIAKHPDVYIFDDSFSALDYKTDTVLRSALKEKTTDSVVLIVAQRISTILHAEQIIVLDDGKIVGKGTHEELLKTCDAYYQIAASQLSESELKEAMKEED